MSDHLPKRSASLLCVSRLLALTVLVLSSAQAMAQNTFVLGQLVAGGGKSAAAQQEIVGFLVSGSGGTSSGGGFRIESGAIHYQAPLAAAYSGAAVAVVDAVNRTLKVSVEGGTGTITGRFFSRLGGEDAFTQVAMTAGVGDTVIHALPASRLTIRGLEYYFEVERGGSTVQVGTASSPFVFITRLQNASGASLPAGQYRMIGFPFDVSPATPAQVFEDDLGAYDPTIWRLGRFNPQTDQYDEYPSIGTVARGRGYWLITRDGEAVGASGQSTVPDTTVTDVDPDRRYGTITLSPGWNQIATPFAFDILWNDRIAESGIENVLWGYTSGFDATSSYIAVQRVRPFEGYWLFNSASGPRRLLLPYVEAPESGGAGKSVAASAVDWSMNLAVRSGRVGDLTNVAGSLRGASIGADEYDFSEPPVIGDYVSLAFVPDAASGSTHLLAGDFRPADDSLYVFNLLLRGNVTSPAHLTATFEAGIDEDVRAVLVEIGSGRVVDLRTTPEIALGGSLTDEGTRYKLIVGRDGDPLLPDPTTTPLPRSFALEQNYPNPFNAATTIRFDVAAAGHVKITVFDVLGATVRSLADKVYVPGRYEIVWDARDEHGREAASGIYFYRFETSGTSLTKKMALLK